MPSPTPTHTNPGWGGPYAATDDWSNQSFYNTFLAAVWERLLVSGMFYAQPSYPAGGGATPTTAPPVNPARPPKVKLYSAGPPAVQATELQGTGSAMTAAAFPFPWPGPLQLTSFTVAEMQQAICDMVLMGAVWTDPTFNLAGVAANSYYPLYNVDSPPPGLMMTLQRLSDLVGVAAPPAVGGVVTYLPFTRQRFRQIFYATGNTLSNHWYGGTGAPWDLASAPAAVVGMKAILYEGGQYATAVPGVGLIGGTAGVYKGVYVYQGGGTWTPSAVPGDVPDLLSSTETPGSNNYCAPYWMQHGDLYGPWIWTDLYNCCHNLSRLLIGFMTGQPAFSSAAPFACDMSGLTGGYDTTWASHLAVGASYATAADAMAAADAIWPGSPSALAAGSVTSPAIGLGASYFFSGGTGGFGATIEDCECRFGSQGVYQGRAGSMQTYLLGLGSPWTTVDNNGTGVVDGYWSLFDTTALPGTGGDVFGESVGATIYGGTKPAWPSVSGSAASRGMTIDGVILLVDWTAGFVCP